MQEVEIEVPSERARLSELREPIERALAELLPEGLLRSHWDEETLHLTGPGADATVRLERGRLIGRARLEPPASLMRSRIEEKMSELLHRVAAAGAKG